MRAQPRVAWQAVGTRFVQIVFYWRKWLEVFLVRPHGRKQIGKATHTGVSFHGLKHPSRISLTSRFRKEADFQGAHRCGLPLQAEVLVRPSNYFIPPAVGEFLTARNIEGKRHTKAARHHV